MVDCQVLTVMYHPHAGGGPLAIGWGSVGGKPVVDRLRTDEQKVGGLPGASNGGPPAIDSGVSST